ncbi:MAG: hypothetical protein NDJ19_15055 [Ramlibacter sp.]|nr:hypothetical protein [Ramlibacter sp.]
MSIYRCNKCGFVSEDAATPVGEKVSCGRCGTPCTVYGTVFFVEKLVERYFSAIKELNALKQEEKPQAPQEDAQAATDPPSDALDVDERKTAQLATARQHAPLQAWFSSRQIEAKFDLAAVDTSGFFDDAAQRLGQRLDLFAELIDRVRFAYRKGQNTVFLDLSKIAQKDSQAITALCRELYSHTFFARYYYQKQEKHLRLNLQSAPAIRQFFDGGWLEWFVFAEVLEIFRKRGKPFSCARDVKIVFANEDLHELDIVFLQDGQTAPICIECKSGEFRRDIDKYLRLRKRLGVDRSRFVICSADLTDEQAAGLSAMYELTFVSLTALHKQLDSLV